ncbi:MAG: hypothetical protein J6W03_07985 [Bacteroidaceae bacterium]|nr:hypothetical protein [Bacteroidaceae bacterium]
MKKYLLFSVMVLVALSASAQFKTKPTSVPQAQTNMVNKAQTQRSFQATAPRTDLIKRSHAIRSNKFILDAANLKPVTRAMKTPVIVLPAVQSKMANRSKVQKITNLQPTMTLTSRANAPRKAPAFAKEYTGTGIDYFTDESQQWTMKPTTATYVNDETEEEEEVDVLVNIMPTPDYLSSLYPDGIPMEYSVTDDSIITIMPQTIASYPNEAEDTTFYLTIFSPLTEDGSITMKVSENGKLTIVDGDYIALGEFANVGFDAAWQESEAFVSFYELTVNVSYYFQLETKIETKYKAHGVDFFANEPADWVLQRGIRTIDGETTNILVDLTPLDEVFSTLYPDGIDVEYEQNGRTITVKPQVIASTEEYYVIVFSATSEDGSIVLTEDKNGLLTIDDESIVIGAWTTSEYDPTFESYAGGYVYIDKPKYRTYDAPPEAPEDVVFEPENLVLFAGLGLSGYSYYANLGMMGAYAPTSFRNETFDVATGFEWSVTETDDDDVETTITGNDRDFTLNTKGGALYSDFTLIGYNEKEASKPYTWGKNNMVTDDDGNPTDEPLYTECYIYAGSGANSFMFSDGTYATMSRQNPDYELTFYINWATPDIYAQYSSNPTSMSTIYSYQGKPATPLYLTGVTLPMVDFVAQDDFNLHIKLCKCERSAKGDLTIGEIIAEGDATTANVNDEFATSSGLTAVNFDELYIEDEFGMSETVDYLFIEDEFVIIIEGWDNGTFSGVLGSHSYNFNEITSTWFQETDDDSGRMYSYQSRIPGWPQLFIGLLDATYGYLYTEDDTDLKFDTEGGTASVHVNPMYYSTNEDTEQPSYRLFVESVLEDDEEVEDVPEWLTVEVANEDYTTATDYDEDGDEYEYFVNGIDYDLVFTAEALPEGVQYRTAKIVFYQEGAKLTVTVAQGVDPDGISTIVESTPIKNRRPFNLAGQPVGKNYRGIVVKDGKKVLVK